MKHISVLIITALIALPVLGGVSFEEKKNRVEYLEELQKKVPAMDISVYQRELEYEKQNLNVEERAKNEANLLVEQIKDQIVRAYEAALLTKSSEAAAAEVKKTIEKDTRLLAPELQDEIRMLSLRTLEDIQRGEVSSEEDVAEVEKALMKAAQERYNFLNQEASTVYLEAQDRVNSNAAERLSYSTRKELVSSLVSSELGVAKWTATGVTLKTNKQYKTEASISLQVKAEFMGVSVSAGPVVTFSRKFSTDVQILAEDLTPLVLPDGSFDFNRRDASGKVILKNGKPVRRLIYFFCEANLEFGTDAKTGGGFSFEGIGGGTNVTESFSNLVTLNSRWVFVPDSIDNKTVSTSTLSEICMNDFLKANITNNMTVKDSLNVMMKNLVSGLRYSHPKTTCLEDEQCSSWFKKDLLALQKVNNIARCVRQSNGDFFSCELRGLEGQNCAVIENGKRLSDGKNEFTCDTGLGCVKYEMEGFFKSAKGKCMPLNRRTYKKPNQ